MSGIRRLRPDMRVLASALLLAALVPLAGCGADDGGSRDDLRKATVVLDYLPNAVHAGIYRAKAAGYYEEEGIDLEVVSPSSTSDTIRLVAAGEADFGLADGIDLATKVSRGRQVRGVMAILSRPAGGLISVARGGPESPADLAGKTVGLTGAPSDRAVFETIVETAGGDPSLSSTVVIGFNGIQALSAGRVEAFTGYLPEDATALEARGTATRTFPFDRWGGPAYPGLVAFSSPELIRDDPVLVRGFVDATVRGYRDALANPARAISALAVEVGGVDRRVARRALEAYAPLIGRPAEVGRVDPGVIRELSGFLLGNGLIERPVAPGRYFTEKFTGSY